MATSPEATPSGTLTSICHTPLSPGANAEENLGRHAADPDFRQYVGVVQRRTGSRRHELDHRCSGRE